MNKDKAALKSGFWYLIANFAVKAMALITTPIFTRLLTKEEYGDYGNFTSWASIAVIVVTMSMEASLISAKYDYEDRLNQYNLSILTLTLVTTAFWAIIINLLSGFFVQLTGLRLLYLNMMLLYCFFYAAVNIFQIGERFHFRYKRSVFIALAVAVSTTLLSILLVLTMKNGLTGRIVGQVLPYMVIGLVLIVYFIRTGKKIDFSAWPYVLKICLPFVPHLLSLTLLNSVDRIMITRICGSTDTALYYVAYTSGHVVTLLMTSMNSAFSSWLGEKLHNEDIASVRKVSRYYIAFFCAIAVLMMLLAPEVLLVMGGKGYAEAQYVMTPVAMGCVCQFLYTLYVNVEQYKKKTLGMAFASIAAAVLNYVLNAIFIPQYGYIAAAYTTLAGYLFLLLCHMILVGALHLGNVYDSKFVLAVTAAMLAVTVGVNFLYGSPVLRYVILAIVAGIIIAVIISKRTLALKLVRMVFGKGQKE